MPDYRINEQIKAKLVRLVSPDGSQLGIVSREEALEKAREAALDLVEVAPDADPPVCRLLDYGKFKYRQKKKRHGQKHHRARLKEIRIGLNTDPHHLDFKADRIIDLLRNHDKVMVTMRLHGREKAQTDLAIAHMTEFASRFAEVAQIERGPELSGSGQLTLLLKPK